MDLRRNHYTFAFLKLLFFASAIGIFPKALEAQPPAPAAPRTSQAQAAAAIDPAIEAGLKQAVETFNKSDFNGAYTQLKELHTKFPRLAPPRVVMAQWFAQANLGEAVRASLELAVAENPNDPEAYILLAEILLRQRFATAADLLLQVAKPKLDAYAASADRKKILTTAWLRNSALLAEARGRWDIMLTYLDENIRQNGETPVLLRQKGIALFQAKKEAEALAQFVRADALAKTTAASDTGLPAEAAIAQLYQLRRDKVNAQRYLAEALRKYPQSREVVVLSVQSRISEDQLEDARRLAEQLLTANPSWSPAKRLLATVALYLGDYPVAEKLYQELILESPADEQAVNGLALALCEQNDPQKSQRALEYARDNVRKKQQETDYWATLGWVLFKSNQMEPAAQALKQAAASGQVNAATAYYLARMAMQSGQTAEATRFLEAALGTPAPFAKRRDAVKLLSELKK